MLRKRRGLSQEDLAGLMQRSVETVSNLERGVSLPSFTTLVRLAESLGVPIRDFFDFGDDATAADPRRQELLAALAEIARGLETDDLAVAVEQMDALAARGSKSGGGEMKGCMGPSSS